MNLYPTLSPRMATTTWCARMFKGWVCRCRLDRYDVSPLVYALFDDGENTAALAACERAQTDNPQNVYAYLHAIDLSVRCCQDFARARESFRLGVTILDDAGDRELLECFHLYATSFVWRH